MAQVAVALVVGINVVCTYMLKHFGFSIATIIAVTVVAVVVITVLASSLIVACVCIIRLKKYKCKSLSLSIAVTMQSSSLAVGLSGEARHEVGHGTRDIALAVSLCIQISRTYSISSV